MNISLPNALKEFVEGQVAEQGYGTSSEYVRELIRKDRDRQSLRALVMEGARSAPASPADAAGATASKMPSSASEWPSSSPAISSA